MPTDKKISALPAVVTPSGTDTLEVVQGGVSKKETVTQILAAEVTARTSADTTLTTNVSTLSSTKASIASPTFTGVPAAPTAAANTNTTQLATTAFATTADNLRLRLSGADTMLGALNMGSNKINNLTDGTSAQDAVSLTQMQAADLYKASRLKTYDPTATSAFPVTGISGGTIVIGDRYYISANGTMASGTAIASLGDIIEARVNGATDAVADWSLPNNKLQLTGTTFVSKNGVDATGTAGRMDKPFLTISAAEAATSSGQEIMVFPGTYTANGLGKAGVNYHFVNGAVVNCATSTLFTGAGLTYSISGDGVFNATSGTIISMTGASSVSIRGKSVSSTTGVLFKADNTSILYINFTESISNSSNGICFQVLASGATINAISATVSTVLGQITSSAGPGKINIKASTITSSGILFDGQANGNIYGNLIHTGSNFFIQDTQINIADTTLNLYGDITSTSTGSFYSKSQLGSTGFFNYINIYGRVNTAGFINNAAADMKMTVYNDFITSFPSVPAAKITLGNFRLKGKLVNNSTPDPGAYVIDLAGGTGTVILENATLVTQSSTASSMNASTAQNVIVLGSAMANTAKDVDITILAGIFIVDTNVQ